MENSQLRESVGQGLRDYVKWAVKQELADIPAYARQKSVMIIADDLAAMLSAENEPEVVAAHSRLVADGPEGRASLFRHGRPQLSVMKAALGNALSASWNELDEGYRKAVCHAGLYTLPALLAIAESENLPVSEVIRASTLAYETTARFARTWRFGALKIHPHALFCAVGVTAAVGFIRRLPADLMLSAFSNASTLGVVGPYNQAGRGALIRNAWAAAGINNGFQAIDWAMDGITGLPETPHDVYFETLGSEANIAELTADLGTEWAVTSGYHKLNACCQYAHSSIEAMQQILREHPTLLGGAGIERIQIKTHPLGMTLNDHQPVTTLGAKFSMPHALAASLFYGHGSAEAFGSAAVGNKQVAALRARVDMHPVEQDLPWPQDRPAFLTLVGMDGQTYSASCLSARGGPDRPFGEEELWDKIEGLSTSSTPGLTATMQTIHALAGDKVVASSLARPWRQWVDQFYGRADTSVQSQQT